MIREGESNSTPEIHETRKKEADGIWLLLNKFHATCMKADMIKRIIAKNDIFYKIFFLCVANQ
jgi:hypothetical protein